MHISSKRETTILALLGAAVALLIGFGIVNNVRFHVVSTNPKTSSVSTISPFFKINFNRTLAKDGLRVVANPADAIGKYSASGKTITITLQPLQAKQRYTITVVSVQAAGGQQLTNKQFEFTPTFIASTALPQDQRQALLDRENIGGLSTNDPILKHLPHQTVEYSLSADVLPQKSKQNMPLTAEINLTISDMSNQAAATATKEQLVIDYIHSLGLDPAQYQIQYIVNTP